MKNKTVFDLIYAVFIPKGTKTCDKQNLASSDPYEQILEISFFSLYLSTQ